jgi:hypothetical protein
MNPDVFLDLNKVELYGYESRKSDKVIEAIIRGISSGDTFPAVNVCEVEPGKFLLLRPEGGHQRACGHYIENKPLRCNVWDLEEDVNVYYEGQKVRDFVEADWPERVFIGDIELADDDKMVDNYENRKRTRFYR